MQQAQAGFDPAQIAHDFAPAKGALNQEDAGRAGQIAQGLDLTDPIIAMGFGAGAQRELSEYAGYLLSRAASGSEDMAQGAISGLLEKIRELNIGELGEEKGGFFGRVFGGAKRGAAALRRDYGEITLLVDRLAAELDRARLMLLKDISLLDTMYDKNLAAYRALSLLISAGEEALGRFRAEKTPLSAGGIPGLDGSRERAEAAERFAQRLHQLRLSQNVSLQMAAQILLSQFNQRLLADKLQQSLYQAIPLWQNQLAMALNIQRQHEHLGNYRDSMRTATDAMRHNTRELKEGAAALKQADGGGAGSLEELRQADRQLIAAMEEALRIQRASRESRQKAEANLSGAIST